MAKRYKPKKLAIFYEQMKAAPEEVETRLNGAFDILFCETLKFLNQEKQRGKVFERGVQT